MLAKIDQVDVISVTPQKSWRLILAIDEGEWDLNDSQWLLQEKFNAYAAYALDGQMGKMYPESVGKPVSIVVSHADPIPPDIAKFIEQIAAIFAQDGLTVTVEPLPAAEAA